MQNLLDHVEIREVGAPVANASNTDSNTDRIDMTGWDGICFVTVITDCANTGVATLKVEQNTADSDSGMAALSGADAAGTSGGDDDMNDKLLIVDVYKPRERFVQAVRTSATANIAFGSVIAILYRGSKLPFTPGATVQDYGKVVSPAEA